MFHDLEEMEQDFPEYSDIFDVIDGPEHFEDDAAYFEQLALDEDAYGSVEDMYANDWESAAFQPEYE